MLRYRPSEVELTPDDIQLASLRINSRKKMTTVRPPPPSLRRSMVLSPQQPMIRRGPERSRDDAVIHSGDASVLRPHLHAEHISLRCSSAGLNRHTTKDRTARRGSDSFSDSAGSVSISASPSPVLHHDTRHFKGGKSLIHLSKSYLIVTYFVLGHRICTNPLSMLRLAAQQPAAKNTSTPLSSSPNLRPRSRHTVIGNSGQGVCCPETYPTSDHPESPRCKLVIKSLFWASLTIESRMGDSRTSVCKIHEPWGSGCSVQPPAHTQIPLSRD